MRFRRIFWYHLIRASTPSLYIFPTATPPSRTLHHHPAQTITTNNTSASSLILGSYDTEPFQLVVTPYNAECGVLHYSYTNGPTVVNVHLLEKFQLTRAAPMTSTNQRISSLKLSSLHRATSPLGNSHLSAALSIPSHAHTTTQPAPNRQPGNLDHHSTTHHRILLPLSTSKWASECLISTQNSEDFHPACA